MKPGLGEANLGALVGAVVGATGGLFAVGIAPAIMAKNAALLAVANAAAAVWHEGDIIATLQPIVQECADLQDELAVANATGTCGECRYAENEATAGDDDLHEPGTVMYSCLNGVCWYRDDPYQNPADFGCSLWEARTP